MPTHRLTLYALLVTITAFLISLILIGIQTGTHGLQRTRYGVNGYTEDGQWPWPYVDGADFQKDDLDNRVQRITFSGIVWRGTPGQALWRVTHSGAVRINVNDKILLDIAESLPLTTTDIPVAWADAQLNLHVELKLDLLAQPAPANGRLKFGIYEQQPLTGWWQLLPSHSLYTNNPELYVAEREANTAALLGFALAGFSVAILILLLLYAWQLQLWRYQSVYITIGLGIATFVVRFIVLMDRAANDPLLYWITPGGDDNYLLMARQILAHKYQLAGTLSHPGTIVWLTGVVTLFGPHLSTPYLMNVLVSSVGICVLVAASWFTFGRNAATIGGILAVLYPPLVFYQATLQTAPMEVLWTELALLTGIIVLKRPSLVSAAVYGFTLGIATLVRATSSFFLIAFLLILFITRRDPILWKKRRPLTIGLLTIGSLLLTLVPQTLLNMSVGIYSPISGSGPITLFAGNNRDTDGSWRFKGMVFDAVELQGSQWAGALLEDVRSDPIRIVSLLLHKVGDFWSQPETMNNVDYERSGLGASPLLRSLSFNGRIGMVSLSVLGWLGIAFLLLDPHYRREHAVLLTIGMTIICILGIALFVIAGRMRVPVMPLLCVTGGVAFDRAIQAIKVVSYRRRLVIATAISIILFIVMDAAARYLPRKSFFYGEPSASLIHRQTNFNDELRFLGFSDVRTDHQPGGYLYLTVYWETLKSVSENYAAVIEFTDKEGKRVAGVDWVLGAVGYPAVKATQWPARAKLAESLLVQFPDEVPPILDVRLGMYRPQSFERIPIVGDDGQITDRTSIALFRFGVIQSENSAILKDDAVPTNFTFGDTLRVTAYRIPDRVDPKDGLPVELQVEAIAPIWEDHVLYFHLFDKEGKLIVQNDNDRLIDDWTTSALIPGHPMTAKRILPLPPDLPTGKYRLLMGFYAFPSLERLHVKDAQQKVIPDRIAELAEVNIVQN